jgi:hypothetical protein
MTIKPDLLHALRQDLLNLVLMLGEVIDQVVPAMH